MTYFDKRSNSRWDQGQNQVSCITWLKYKAQPQDDLVFTFLSLFFSFLKYVSDLIFFLLAFNLEFLVVNLFAKINKFFQHLSLTLAIFLLVGMIIQILKAPS